MYFVSLLILQYKHGIKKHRREFRYDNVINLCLTLFFFLSKLKNTISCWLKVWDRKLIKVNRAFTEKQNLQNWKFFVCKKKRKLKKHAKGFSFCVRNTIPEIKEVPMLFLLLHALQPMFLNPLTLRKGNFYSLFPVVSSVQNCSNFCDHSFFF